MLYDGFYGSQQGGWVYPRLSHETTSWSIVLGLLLAAGVVFFAWVSRRFIERRPTIVIGLWLVTGFFAQLAIWSLSNYNLADIVDNGANGFFEVAARHSAREFLRDFHSVSLEVSFHVRANLAGKVLFFQLLRCVTESPRETAWLILWVSNLGGVLVYAITNELFRNRSIGLTALILYLFLPAKLYFFPLMNTVTPVFILLPLWLLLRYCGTHQNTLLVAVGLSLYWLVLFDPLPLVMGLVFLAVLARAFGRGEIGPSDLAKIVFVVPLSFTCAAVFVSWAYGYDLLEAGRFAIAHAKEFNELNNRPYDIWFVQNPIDFLVNTGILTSFLFLCLATTAIVRTLMTSCHNIGGSASEAALRVDLALVLSVLAVLVVLNWMGINRGETIRLWIFLSVFVAVPVAAFCARRPVLFAIVITSTLVQTCVTLPTRGFVVPW